MVGGRGHIRLAVCWKWARIPVAWRRGNLIWFYQLRDGSRLASADVIGGRRRHMVRIMGLLGRSWLGDGNVGIQQLAWQVSGVLIVMEMLVMVMVVLVVI